MESKRPTRGMCGKAPDPELPRLCVAPWHTAEDAALAGELCPGGCVPGGCALALDRRRWPATGWDRELTARERAALRRCALGGWTNDDRAVVEALCGECRACGCAIDESRLIDWHMRRDDIPCPGFCLAAPPRMLCGRGW